MRNAGLDEVQTGIKIARRNISNLKYAYTPPLWQKVKRTKKPLGESERGDPKVNSVDERKLEEVG